MVAGSCRSAGSNIRWLSRTRRIADMPAGNRTVFEGIAGGDELCVYARRGRQEKQIGGEWFHKEGVEDLG